MEEGLMQYDPLVIDDPRRVLSHRYDVRLDFTSPHFSPFFFKYFKYLF